MCRTKLFRMRHKAPLSAARPARASSHGPNGGTW